MKMSIKNFKYNNYALSYSFIENDEIIKDRQSLVIGRARRCVNCFQHDFVVQKSYFKKIYNIIEYCNSHSYLIQI
jgi:hypothetical protein